MEGDGGCRVGEVRAGTTSPMPDRKGFKLQELVNFQKFSTLRVNNLLGMTNVINRLTDRKANKEMLSKNIIPLEEIISLNHFIHSISEHEP